MSWKLGQAVELCAGPREKPEVIAERTIDRITKRHIVLSSGSLVRHDGTLVHHSMHIRPKKEASQ